MDYWNLYKDVWNFHKKYSKVQTDDTYWEAVVSESGAISKKYDNHKFAIALLLAVIDELERILCTNLHIPVFVSRKVTVPAHHIE